MEYAGLLEQEGALILADRDVIDPSAAEPLGWRSVLRTRGFWAIAIARFLADPSWQTFSLFIPLYLVEAKGLDLKSMAAFAWLPFLGADPGSLLGGCYARGVMRRFDVSLLTSRKIVVTTGAVLMMDPRGSAGDGHAFSVWRLTLGSVMPVLTGGKAERRSRPPHWKGMRVDSATGRMMTMAADPDHGDAVPMTQTMRWFGPTDPVPLAHIRQAGATEVITALHEIPNGEIWPQDAIAARKALIAQAGLGWTVVESLPVHEAVKTRSGNWDRMIQAYRHSLRNLAACGIRIVTYNFMPLLDWTRTDLAWTLADGARALRFEWEAVAAYDIHILCRPDAERDYSPAVCDGATRRYAAMSVEERHRLERTIIAGLPGSEESFTSAQFLSAIASYAHVDADRLRANHHAFLEAVCPVAEEVGIQLVVHPDDPPFPLFGLPRVVSTEQDAATLFAQVPSPANGLCFCTGSFGARRDNDLPGMVRRLGSRIGFLHLRAVALDGERDFHEAAHLEGDARMDEVVAEIVALSAREGRSIPMRPDHGHQMIDDLDKATNPGYSLIGRLRGLAELRGLERGLIHRRRMEDMDG